MSLFRLLFLAFLIVPFIEIYLLLSIGSFIGILPTIVLVVFTAVLGVTLIRAQGLLTLGRLQQKLQRGELPAAELITGVALLISGALLLTPGFFTDTIGFLLMWPAFRNALLSGLVTRNMRVYAAQQAGKPQHPGSAKAGNIIEGEYRSDD